MFEDFAGFIADDLPVCGKGLKERKIIIVEYRPVLNKGLAGGEPGQSINDALAGPLEPVVAAFLELFLLFALFGRAGYGGAPDGIFRNGRDMA